MGGFQTISQADSWPDSGLGLFLIIHLLGIACFGYIAWRCSCTLARERDLALTVHWRGWPSSRSTGWVSGNILAIASPDSSHPYLCRISFPGDALFFPLIVGVSKISVPASRNSRAHLRDHHRLRRHRRLPVHDIAIVRRLVFSQHVMRCRHNSARHTPPTPFSCLADCAPDAGRQPVFGSCGGRAAKAGNRRILAVLSLPWLLKSPTFASLPLSQLYFGAYLFHEVTFISCCATGPSEFSSTWRRRCSASTSPSWTAGQSEAGAVGCQRWASGSGEDLRSQDVRRLHLEAHARFLFLRRLRPVLGPCPANAVGKAAVARFLTIKARDYAFQHYPVFGKSNNGKPLIGEHLFRRRNLVVHHLRRLRGGMSAAGGVHRQDRRFAARHGGRRQRSAVAAKAAEGAGEPWQSVRQDGEEKSRLGEAKEFQQTCAVEILNGKNGAETLYFVDSITSYDDRMQSIGRATARILDTPARTSEFWARRKKTAATMSGASAKRRCSWRCGTTTRRPSRRRE